MDRKRTYRWYPLAICLALIIGSCTERIDIELDSTYRRLVVQGAVTSDSIRHRVMLTTTSDYFSNMPSPRVSGAVVELSFNDQTLVLPESNLLPGLYETEEAFRGVPGTTYTLHIRQVDVDGNGEYEEYQAESTMPGGALLERIDLRYFSTPIVKGYQVLMWVKHPVEQKDRFGFRIWKNSVLLTDSLSRYTVFSDDLFDSGDLPGLPVGFLNDDDPREKVFPGDTILFELESIDQAYYDIVTDAQLELVGNIPLFSGPPANIRSNIDNGGMGIFTAYSIQRAFTVLEP
jgi:hypothetical protein